MRTKTSTWFEVKVKYEKENDKGLVRPVREMYVFDSLTFGEAETKTIDELSEMISGEYTITDIVIAPYKEVVFTENALDVEWFKFKIQFVTYDEKSGKEKYTTSHYLVQAKDLSSSVKNFEAFMSSSMLEYKICSVSETAILDVFEHSKQ